MAAEGRRITRTLDPLISEETLWCPISRVVKIPCEMMLDVMLEELALPKARYDFHANTDGQITVVVTLYSSARMPENLLRPVKLGGAEADNYETTKESAAREAIRFMEAWEILEIEDLHRSELKYLEADRQDLTGKLNVVTKEKKNLQTTLSLAASQVVTFSSQIHTIACSNHSLGQSSATEDINATIKLFEGVAADLGLASKHLKKDLRKNKAVI